MTAPTLLWLIGGAIAIAWVAVRQLRTSMVRRHPPAATVVLRWALLAYGLVLIALVLRSQHWSGGPVTWILLTVLAVLAVGLGIVRGAVTKIWVDESGRTVRRGGIVVLALWAVSLAVHLGVDWLIDRRTPGLGPTTMLAYLVTTIAAQNITVRHRASALPGPR